MAAHLAALCKCCGKAKSLLTSGTHTFEFAGGCVYEGEWKAGQPEGKGKLMWNDGGVYEGGFVGGEMEGEGKMLYKDGTVYEGQFAMGLPDGKCVVKFPNVEKEGGGFYPGAVFEGMCTKAEAEGAGVFKYPATEERKGHWSAGELQYEDGEESMLGQGANAMTGISGASAAAIGGEVSLNMDMRSLKRGAPKPAEAAQDEAPSQLMGFSDVSGAAMGEQVSLDLGMRSMKRRLKGDGEVQGSGEAWHEHEEEEEGQETLTTNYGSMAFTAQDHHGEEVELQMPQASLLSMKRQTKA